MFTAGAESAENIFLDVCRWDGGKQKTIALGE
jgi:hypothetical protein